MASEAGEDEEWVARNDDDGFAYKILKRRRVLDPSSAAPTPVDDAKAEENRRKQRKKKTFLKLKSRYQKELDLWELLSNNLRAKQDKASKRVEMEIQHQDVGQTAAPLELTSMDVEGSDNVCDSLIDQLLCQAEMQELIINDVNRLCDIVESMCIAQQEQLANPFIDLPIWSSPRELMASLCDEYFGYKAKSKDYQTRLFLACICFHLCIGSLDNKPSSVIAELVMFNSTLLLEAAEM